MNLLALETSTCRLSVALWRDGQVISRSEHRPNGGSDLILPWVGELLAEAGLTLAQLDGVAFGAGPGGFTGLRLACGVAQGLAWGADLPVVPVGTLEALAVACCDEGAQRIYTCLDARMGEVYTAAFDVVAGHPLLLLDDAVSAPELAPLPPGSGWRGGGDGFTRYAGRLNPGLLAVLDSCLAEALPDAAAVARLAAPRLAGGEGVAAHAAQPRYVRDKVALTTAERLARGGVR